MEQLELLEPAQLIDVDSKEVYVNKDHMAYMTGILLQHLSDETFTWLSRHVSREKLRRSSIIKAQTKVH